MAAARVLVRLFSPTLEIGPSRGCPLPAVCRARGVSPLDESSCSCSPESTVFRCDTSRQLFFLYCVTFGLERTRRRSRPLTLRGVRVELCDVCACFGEASPFLSAAFRLDITDSGVFSAATPAVFSEPRNGASQTKVVPEATGRGFNYYYP